MARAGIQFWDVEKAAIEVQGMGKIPTIDNIREILGTGSRTTLAKHLKAWRDKQTEAGGALPKQLAAAVTGVWRQLNDDANQRIHDVEIACQQQLEQLNQTIQRAQQTETTLKHQLHNSEKNIAIERTEKEQLQQRLQDAEREKATLAERCQATSKQLETAKGNNARLHQLATNIQSNLEHYQEQIQRQQTKQTLKVEKQQAMYRQEIDALKQKAAQQHHQITTLEQERENLQANIDTLNDKYQALISAHNNTQQQIQAANHEKTVLLERINQAHDNANTWQEKADSTEIQLRDQEKQLAVMSHKNEELKNDLSSVHDKMATLHQDKLILMQDKARLDGYLKTLSSETQDDSTV